MVGLCFQNSFDHRMKTWQKWQDAQNTLQKKREVEAKLLWANKPDKLQQAKEEITEVIIWHLNCESTKKFEITQFLNVFFVALSRRPQTLIGIVVEFVTYCFIFDFMAGIVLN